MSVPGNINPAPPPSSFDDDADFYEESRFRKLRRRVMEEPVIPLGCALTCWALYEATKSMKSGDHYRTNRMFRRRIYAQGFTILAMVAGSIYWETDRKKRKEYTGLVDEKKKKKEKYDAWIRELEIREEEEQELRGIRQKVVAAERERLTQDQKVKREAKVKAELGQPKGGLGVVKSVLEESESRRRPILQAAIEAWSRRR